MFRQQALYIQQPVPQRQPAFLKSLPRGSRLLRRLSHAGVKLSTVRIEIVHPD